MMTGDMLHIETCAKQGDRFVPLDALKTLKVKEPLYVDGSIRVTTWGQPLITDAQWTDIVHWWAGMSNVLRDLTHANKDFVEDTFPDTPTAMLFEVTGNTLIWTVRGANTKFATLDRVPALRILMREYRCFFERMKVLNPSCATDYDVALDYMSQFKPL